ALRPEAPCRAVRAPPGCSGPEADRAGVPGQMPFPRPSTVQAGADLPQPPLHLFFGGHHRHADVALARIVAADLAGEIGARQHPDPRLAPDPDRRGLAVVDRKPEEEAALGTLVALHAREDPVGQAELFLIERA